MNQFQTKKFRQLQKVWYLKLEETGFEDAEDTNSENEFLKTWHSSYFQTKYDPHSFESKRDYYDCALEFLHRNYQNHQYGLFEYNQESRIWELHCEGLSLREIARKLTITVYQVNKVVTSLKQKMLKAR